MTTIVTKVAAPGGDFSMSGSRRFEVPANFRSGVAVRQQGTVQDDYTPSQSSPKAVAIFAQIGDKILAVGRRGNAADLNMPGGMVDPGEDYETAAHRELFEETGLSARKLIRIYAASSNGIPTVTFKAIGVTGKLRSSSEGPASLEPPENLMRSTFSDYFLDMLAAVPEKVRSIKS